MFLIIKIYINYPTPSYQEGLRISRFSYSGTRNTFVSLALIAGLSSCYQDIREEEITPTNPTYHSDVIRVQLPTIKRTETKQPQLESIIDSEPFIREPTTACPETKIPNNRPEIYDQLQYQHLVDYDFSQINFANPNTKIGIIQRVLRYRTIFRTVENAYKMPPYLLGAMSYRESGGNPIRPNNGNDGGFGIIHIQGSVARNILGVKTCGYSRRISDKQHGIRIIDLLFECHHDIRCVSRGDERGNPTISNDGAARFMIMKKGARRFWRYGAKGFRSSGNPRIDLEYENKVRLAMPRLYLPKWHEKVAADFNERNKGIMDYDTFLKANDQIARNWGIEIYAEHKGVKVWSPEDDEAIIPLLIKTEAEQKRRWRWSKRKRRRTPILKTGLPRF